MSKSQGPNSDASSVMSPRGVVCKVMAACIALAAFMIALIGGLFAANPTPIILSRALIAMVLCYPVGYIIGVICDRVLRDHITQYQQEHAPPANPSPENSANEFADEKDEEIITV